MARTITFIAAALLVLYSPAFAVPQDESAATATAPATAETEGAQQAVEEVVVRGRRTLFSLRREPQSARENVWEVFSAINSYDDFDIACTSAPGAGSPAILDYLAKQHEYDEAVRSREDATAPQNPQPQARLFVIAAA